MPIAKGKHDLRTHIPLRTYQFLKSHAEGRQIGQMIADCVDCYANQGKMARQLEVMGTHLEHVMTLLERLEAPNAEAHT